MSTTNIFPDSVYARGRDNSITCGFCNQFVCYFDKVANSYWVQTPSGVLGLKMDEPLHHCEKLTPEDRREAMIKIQKMVKLYQNQAIPKPRD